MGGMSGRSVEEGEMRCRWMGGVARALGLEERQTMQANEDKGR